jgi:transcription-repair coupling factor (superfamily II helicase)
METSTKNLNRSKLRKQRRKNSVENAARPAVTKDELPQKNAEIAKKKQHKFLSLSSLRSFAAKTRRSRRFLTQRRKGLARQSRNQKNFTEANEGNEEQEKFCQKCAILGNSTAKAQRASSILASWRLGVEMPFLSGQKVFCLCAFCAFWRLFSSPHLSSMQRTTQQSRFHSAPTGRLSAVASA